MSLQSPEHAVKSMQGSVSDSFCQRNQPDSVTSSNAGNRDRTLKRRNMLCRGWVCSGFQARRKPGPQLQTGVRRGSEACPGRQVVGKKMGLLQQKRRMNRVGKARSGGSGKRSGDCIVIVRWKFNVVGLRLRGGDKQIVGLLVQKIVAMLKLGIEYGRYNDPGKRQQCCKRENNEPRVGFHD